MRVSLAPPGMDLACLQVGVTALLLCCVTLYPIAWHLRIGWAWRRLLINRSLTIAAKDEYLAMFQRQPRCPASAEERFETFYTQWYGRRHVAVPAGFLALVVALVSWLLAAFAFSHAFPRTLPSTVLIIPLPAAAALAGSYAFTTFDMIERVTRRDLSANDICLAAFRLLISIPLGYVIQALAAPGAGALLAFAISAFPFEAVAAGLRKLGSRQLGLDVGADNAAERVTLLAGVDLNIADRIREADVSTISQLAYSDPIQLAMRTNLGFTYMIDVVSQALAWVYLGDKLNIIRPFGLRGAFEIVVLQHDLLTPLSPQDPPKKRVDSMVARKLLKEASSDLKMTPSELLSAIRQIADDPYSVFLLKVYG